MTTVAHPPPTGYRTIRLPLSEHAYERFLSDRTYAKVRLQELYEDSPELFPVAFPRGSTLYGFTEPSWKQQQLRCRRLRLDMTQEVFTVAPAFVMPYRSGRVDAVEKALFFMRFHVPCWAIADVFGRDAMYWYRWQQGLGRFSIVGTTVKAAEHFPKDLVADEKHRGVKGPRVSLATTAGRDGILGASVAPSASPPDWKQASGIFAHEATALDEDYTPHTVNTDGWHAPQGAWKALFPNITVIVCFLHAFFTIRDRATQALGIRFAQVQERVWAASHAPSQRAFSQRVRRLRAGAETALPDSAMQTHTLDLCDKRARFSLSYDHCSAHRTSNMVDRLMKFLDRACFNAQYFHGTFEAAESRVRAWALLWNCCPSSPGTVSKYYGQACPAARLNGKRYAENWLENLLISGSMNGVDRDQQIPL
jgi:hypothetical protein